MLNRNTPTQRNPSAWLSLNLIVVAVLSAVLTGIGLQQMSHEASRLRQDFRMSGDALVNELAHSLSVPLYNYDKKSISNILQSHLTDKDIYAIYLMDNVLNILIGFSKYNDTISPTSEYPSKSEILNDQLIKIESPVHYGQREIGKIIAYFSYISLNKDLDDRSIIIRNWMIGIGISSIVIINTLAWIYLFLSNKLDHERRRLSESEARFRAITDSAQDAIFCKDKDLNYTFANPAFARMVGTPLSQIIGRSVHDFLPSQTAEMIHEEDKRTLQGEVVNLVKERKAEGSDRVLHIVQVPMRDEDNRIYGISGIVRDISNVKRLQDQLRQAQKMEAIGTLAGGIAHDFNNILGAIMGYTELALLNRTDRTDGKVYLDEVMKAGKRAKELVNRILAFSRQTEQELKPVRASHVVKDALKLLRASLPTTIEIRSRVEAEDPVMGDPTQIHQIIMNLCTNAAHAMREEGGVLEVNLERVELDSRSAVKHPGLGPGLWVQLTVSDTGHGIPPKIMERIFEPFFTTKAVGEGTGLGLSMVHGIVQSYGGAIEVQSQANGGTSFKVLLPVVRDKPEISRPDDRRPAMGRGHILFIDDEEPLVELGKQMLRSFGYEVTALADSAKALERFKKSPFTFDAIVTDITMPNMTGIRLSQEIKKIRPEIPIIGCTGYSDKVSPDSAWQYGIDTLLMKPIESIGLADVLRELLSKKKQAR